MLPNFQRRNKTKYLVVEKESGEMTDLRTMVLKQLEQGPLDVFALREDLNVDFVDWQRKLSILLEAGYANIPIIGVSSMK